MGAAALLSRIGLETGFRLLIWGHAIPISAEATRQISRSEEHTSELQSLTNIVCRLLLEKKKKHMPYSAPAPACRTTDRPAYSPKPSSRGTSDEPIQRTAPSLTEPPQWHPGLDECPPDTV